MRQGRHLLVMFAKAPVPGTVKTRLQPPLNPNGAAQLHAAFLLDLAERLLSGHELPGFTGWLSVAGDTDHPVIAEIGRMGIQIVAQRGSDLGDRMACAIEDGLAAGFETVTLIGSDSPTLPADLVTDAVARLETADVVFAPTFDGGFALVSAKVPIEAMRADIAWSTEMTLVETIRAVADSKLLGDVVGFWYDIDQAQDLEFLSRHLLGVLGSRSTGLAPRTAGWLVEHGWNVTS